MGNKLEPVKLVSNIMVSIVLLIIYAHFFGRFSIQRYLARDVMIIEQEEKNISIPQPGNVSCEAIIVTLNLICNYSHHYISRKSQTLEKRSKGIEKLHRKWGYIY